jgi:hypothetical protein
MNYFLIIYLVIGIVYIFNPIKVLEKYSNSSTNKNCKKTFQCNSKLIAKSINRIRKKYLDLEENLKDIKLI